MSRPAHSVPTRIVLSLVIVGLAVAASARTAGPATAAVPARAADRAAPARNLSAAPAAAAVLRLIAPVPGHGPAALAQAGQAAATCAAYATRAGWANNGYYGGDLVTAAAICVGESTGKPGLYVCDENGGAVGGGTFPPAVNCPVGTTSYDRGLWQLNSKAAASVSDRCAFDPLCNADHAYRFSEFGTSFAPWASYDQDSYASFIDVVQAVVTRLGAGTVTSALLGECLAQARPVRGAEVVLANCGTGASTQQWSIGGGKLRAGGVCATIASTSGNPNVVLSRCGRSRSQVWRPFGRDELRNAADGKCLTDPGSSLKVGTQVKVTRCVNAKAQVWWLP